MEHIQLNPIGRATSCYPEKFGTPRQSGLVSSAEAFIEIFKEYQPEISLSGLSSYSHMWLLFLFHLNKTERFHAKVHPPRLDGKTMGLFATRTPHRPNPIGLSLVEIVKVEESGVRVKGIDLVDDTPILDIKPYLPQTESIPSAKSGWVEELRNESTTVDWQETALQKLRTLVKDIKIDQYKALIENTVRLDPRPLVYKNENFGESKYRDFHTLRIYELDIEFKFESRSLAQILDVRLALV